MLTPLSWVIIALLYYPAIVASETLSPDADSSALPIGGTVIMAAILCLVMLPITWSCVRRTDPPGSLFAWRPDQPFRSALVSIALVGMSVAVVIGDFWGFGRPLPWYEYLTLPPPILLSIWLLALRGAVLSKKSKQVMSRAV